MSGLDKLDQRVEARPAGGGSTSGGWRGALPLIEPAASEASSRVEITSGGRDRPAKSGLDKLDQRRLARGPSAD